MPWQHCDNEKIFDDATCPTCGITKLQWTLEWKVTRVFQVGKKKELKLQLEGPTGDWIADEPFRVELPDGSVHAGALSEVGYAKVPIKGKGICWVTFPDRGAGVVARSDDAVSERTADGIRFGCLPDGQKYVFALEGAAEETLGALFEALDPEGRPLADQPYVVTFADGTRREGRLDARGQAWIEGPPGEARVSLPPWSAEDFGAGPPPPPAPPPLRPAAATPTRERAPAPAAVELELLDDAGAPLAYHAYEVVLADGSLRGGHVDGQGRATLELEQPERCRVRIPGYTTHDFIS